MEPLTFSLVLDKEDERGVRLAPCDMGEISPAMWEQLAGDLAAEHTLIPCAA